MKASILFLSLMLTLPPQAPVASSPPIVWASGYGAARAESRRSGKPTFVYVTRPGCLPCYNTEHYTFVSEEARAAAARFVCVKVDAWKEPLLAEALGANKQPTFVIGRPDGKVTAWWQGFVEPEGFAEALARAATPPQAPPEVKAQAWRTVRVACGTAWRHGGRSGAPVSHDCPKCGNHVTAVSRSFGDGSHEHVCNAVREVRVPEGAR